MEKLINVAGYIYQRYEKDFGIVIDEMKLHKLLYFSQRESYIQNNEPLFSGKFEAWKYGHVVPEIRGIYKEKKFFLLINNTLNLTEKTKPVMDYVFINYAPQNSWSLSTLSHNEISWKNARRGVEINANSHNLISEKDIKKDAENIRFRRIMLVK